MKLRKYLPTFSVFFLAACAVNPAPTPDYTLFQRLLPKTILVLPALNETADVTASNNYMSTVSYPIAEHGYYVFPVAVVERILNENGAPSPVEMRQLSHTKLKELFGADALFDVRIKEWGTTYAFLSSITKVRLTYTLIDLASGSVLWSGVGFAYQDSNSGNNNGLAGMLVGALTHAIVSSATSPEVELAEHANNNALRNDKSGLLKGPRFPPEANSTKH